MNPMLKTACAAALLALSTTQAPAQALDLDAADALFDAALAEVESCPMVFDLTAQSLTRMEVFMLAPCRAGQGVVLDHAGMVLHLTASANGVLAAALPVLDVEAPVTLTFADGTMTDATLMLPITNVRDVAARW